MIDLKAFRKSIKISQKIFCEAVEISQSYVSKIENGKEQISDSAYEKVISVYPEAANYVINQPKKNNLDDKEMLVHLLEKYMKTSTKMEIKIETLLSELNEYRKKYGPLPNN